MIKKFLIFSLVLLFLQGCGYQAIYSGKNLNFSIENLITVGDKGLNRFISKRLDNLNIENKTENAYKLNINSKTTKNIAAKDKQGNPSAFTLTVNIEMLYSLENGPQKSKSFSETINYSNRDNKFELKKYENTTKENLTDKIIDNIILFLQNDSSQ